MPKISVLLPIYKTNPNYLREAIDSILAQTFCDFELLFLDDCPEDSREAIIKSFHDNRIKYFKNDKNLGITPSRNKLIDLANGEYLAVMDHDDIALPTRFEEQTKILDTHPEIGVVGCYTERFPQTKFIKYPILNREIEQYLMQGCAIPHTGAMIRKAVLKDIRYEEKFSPAEDYALWCRLLKKTQFYNIPKVLMRYRWYEGNTSKLQAKKMKNARKSIQSCVRNQYPDIYNDLKNNAFFVVRMKLFGFIPCGKFIQKGLKKRKILKYFPFITTKIKMEIK